MNSLNERKTASLGHVQLSCGYTYQRGGLFNSLNMAFLRKKSMSCDFRLSSVEKKTLQKRRAITIFDQFRLLGNVIHVMICICVVKKSP